MIETIRHKGLKQYFVKGNSSKLPSEYLPRIEYILNALHDAKTAEEMNVSGLYFHLLSGNLKGFYSVRVSANYRIIFRFVDGDAYDVDLIDYH